MTQNRTHHVKLLMKEIVTHDVRRLVLAKPDGYKYLPGQATELSIDKEGWSENKHPFTFTSLNRDKVLEFTIKIYPVALHPDHDGVTEELDRLQPGDGLILREPWGTINYKGPGVFLAGGAGITPFIAIFRQLFIENRLKGNMLYFTNKKTEDVILEKELKYMFGSDLALILTREKKDGYGYGHIDIQYLKKRLSSFSGNFYLCGPRKFVSSLKQSLQDLGASVQNIVFEQ